MHVAIVYSTPTQRISATEYSETDGDTETIARAVSRGLEANGYTVSIHPLRESTLENDILSIHADCIFNLLEWSSFDTPLASLAFKYLRGLNVPITGNNENSYLLSCDKVVMKEKLKAINSPTPEFIVIKSGKEKIPENLRFPVIVKPALEHCSVGLDEHSIATDVKELGFVIARQQKEFAQPLIAEEFINGRELLVYILEKNGEATILPIEELFFSTNSNFAFQTYESKWKEKSSDYQGVSYDLAQLTPREEELVKEACLNTFKELGFWGYARFDLRLKDNIPYILEVNANPSVYDDDVELEDPNVEVIWGIKFKDYLKVIVETAFYHFYRGEKI